RAVLHGRRLSPGSRPAGADRGAEVRAVHALGWDTELARSDHRFPGASGVRDQHQQGRLQPVLAVDLGEGQSVLAHDAQPARGAVSGLAMTRVGARHGPSLPGDRRSPRRWLIVGLIVVLVSGGALVV